MAGNTVDKAITDLDEAQYLQDEDLFVIEQNGDAKSVTGQLIKEYAGSTSDENIYKAFIHKTKYGDLIAFDDGGDDLPVKQLVSEIAYKTSGSTSCTVSRIGKNLLDDTKRVFAGGNIFFGGATSQTAGLSAFLPSGDYTISVETADGTATNLYVKDKLNNEFVSGFPAYDKKSQSFTLDTATEIIVFVYKQEYTSTSDILTAQIEVGDFATAYTPYAQIATYNVDWSNEAGTVYGGALNVTTGVLTSTLDENGDPLPTPMTYHLTPTEVRTLLGYNTIFADTGDVTVTYLVDTATEMDGKVSKTDYNPVVATKGMTQPVGKDANGQLWTAMPAAYPTHIAVTTPPTKTLYEIGNDFNTTGMVVTLYWSNGYTEAVDNADLLITPSTFSVVAEQQSVLLTYTVTPYVLTTTLVVEVRDIILDTWAKVQQVVRAGRAAEYFSVAEEKTTTLGTATKIINVAGFDEMAPVEAGRTHNLVLIADDAWGTTVFDPPQFLYAVRAEDWPDGMPAGTYNIGYATSVSARTYVKFTTTKTVPVGGGFTLSGDLVAGSTLTSRTEDTVTTIESGLALSAAADATDGTPLGVAAADNRNLMSGKAVNFVNRARSGGNRWSTSYFRQQANSKDAVVAFVPATIWSRRPNLTDEGLLYRMDPELVAVLGRTRTRYAIPNCDGGGYEDVEDLVTIPTMLDLNFGNNNDVAEGPVSADGTVLRSTPLSLYVGATNEDRIWYNGASASFVWLPSHYPPYAQYERRVNTSGGISYNDGQNAQAVVPRLTII